MPKIRLASDAAIPWKAVHKEAQDQAIAKAKEEDRVRRSDLVDTTNLYTILETAPEQGFPGWRFLNESVLTQELKDAGYVLTQEDGYKVLWWDHKTSPHNKAQERLLALMIVGSGVLLLGFTFVFVFLSVR